MIFRWLENKTERRGFGTRSGKQKDKEFAGIAMTGDRLNYNRYIRRHTYLELKRYPPQTCSGEFTKIHLNDEM